tara:strand:- start:1596 stop:1901 length:306 start_codon:yes stop_codon:yes gene_type:complete
MSEKKQTLLERIIDGAIDAIKKPFIVKRVERAFASAHDSIEEQLLGTQAEQNTARENLVSAAKNEGNLSSYIQKLVDLQVKVTTLETAKTALEAEQKEFLG